MVRSSDWLPGFEPPLNRGSQRRDLEVVELVATLAPGPNQPGRLQHREVLGNGLPRQAQSLPHGQPGAELEERLAVTVTKLVENGPARGRSQGLEDVRHIRV